jgi:single-strand DNA-binding protein
MNNITIHGNIGQQPELRFTNGGMAVLELNVGDSYGKDDKKKTTWHTVKVFGKLAENVAGTVNKGTTVLVTGRLETESYTKKDGSEGKFTKVIAEEVAVSCRWNMWVRDNTEAVVAQVGKVFANTDQNLPAEEPF